MYPYDKSILQDRHHVSIVPRLSIVRIAEYTDEEFQLLADRYGTAIGSPDRKVSGSLFIKRYNALIMAAFYVWTHHGYALDLSLDKVGVTAAPKGLAFQVVDAGEWDIPAAEAQSFEVRSMAYLKLLFAEHISPIYAKAAKYTKVPESGLWSGLSFLIEHWKQEWTLKSDSDEVMRRIAAVYRIVTEHAAPDWFPFYKSNPLNFQFRRIEDPLQPGRDIILRNTCCMNYRLPGEDRYCYTCPLITDERRMEKYLAAH